ncbi:MAG: hypothetical protein EP339_14290 [Gammaproteobacteria bacterium]|nr:MAG: hypothetical protein EP339_14290 [Gammaproteobacteria bacterium]
MIDASRLHFSYRAKAQHQLARLEPSRVYTLNYRDMKRDMPGTLKALPLSWNWSYRRTCWK